ncbi:hypothetical protein [Mucilaginibacter sp. KACC 22063]|uniref:hypothetical protein n=1 Tax=Mucilaginibacter sp. KACC 22063 TaxID=3025666 RepID=UPI0023657D81|nr:hypothetical protein [Mucilaginibacter sp. KACC 22063]WDF54718.1 hypothetical protein PQ461_17440 [Mucilaginibacter sp. KACC 22063]
MTEFEVTGGGEIGNGRATYPFAKLTVTPYQLSLSISLVGTVVFRPSDVVSLTVENQFLGLRKGIRINHTVANYSNNIIFLSTNAAYLIKQIESTGFLLQRDPLPGHLEEEIIRTQAAGSFPIKKSAAIAIIIIWNALCIPAIINDASKSPIIKAPYAMLLPLGFMMSTCVSLLVIPTVRGWVIKPGHHINSIKTGVIFILIIISIITSVMLAISTIPAN